MLGTSPRITESVLEMVKGGDLELAFELKKNPAEVRALVRNYRDRPDGPG